VPPLETRTLVIALLAFSLTLLVAGLLSGLANRSVLSTAVLFLLAGFVYGQGVTGWIALQPTDPLVLHFAELAIYSVLFVEGMRLSSRQLATAWHLPGKALLFGMPLTLLFTALLAVWLTDLSWGQALLLGAVLSPTDPVFAAAVVGQPGVSARLRHLLNIESGLNDGLALPLVIGLLAYLQPEEFHVAKTLIELATGVALGVIVPWLVIKLVSSRFFDVDELYQSLAVLNIGFLLYALASFTHANQFLAAFSAGVTIATLSPDLRDKFRQIGKLLTELFKLAALLILGALFSPRFFGETGWQEYVFALLVLLVPRPLSLCLALVGAPLSWREWVAAAWFGPKGFASVFLTLLVLRSGLTEAPQLAHLAVLVIAASIILHSSTDVPLSRWLEAEEEAREQGMPQPSRSPT